MKSMVRAGTGRPWYLLPTEIKQASTLTLLAIPRVAGAAPFSLYTMSRDGMQYSEEDCTVFQSGLNNKAQLSSAVKVTLGMNLQDQVPL